MTQIMTRLHDFNPTSITVVLLRCAHVSMLINISMLAMQYELMLTLA